MYWLSGRGKKTTSAMARWHWLEWRPCVYLSWVLSFWVLRTKYALVFNAKIYLLLEIFSEKATFLNCRDLRLRVIAYFFASDSARSNTYAMYHFSSDVWNWYKLFWLAGEFDRKKRIFSFFTLCYFWQQKLVYHLF